MPEPFVLQQWEFYRDTEGNPLEATRTLGDSRTMGIRQIGSAELCVALRRRMCRGYALSGHEYDSGFS